MNVIDSMSLERDAGGKPVSTFPHPALERFPIRWTHLIEKESLKSNKLEHVLIEKGDQLFRNML
jgi:hypothetical protein